MTSLWLIVPLILISILGIVVNAYILLVVIFSRQAASANNLLLLHLGALNVLLGIFFVLFSTPGLIRGDWLTTGAFCHIHGFGFTLLHPLVLWTICGLNADRYYAIAAPLHYGHLVNPKKVLICLGLGWLISLALTIPPFFSIAPYNFNKAFGSCISNFQKGAGSLWYAAAYTAFTLLLPVTLIICCNVKILMIARYHRHRIASAIFEVTLSAQVTITHQRNPFFVPTVTAPSAGGPKFRSRSPVSTVLQLLGSFLILYVPYYSILLWEASLSFLFKPPSPPPPPEGNVDHDIVYQIVLALLTCSPLVNGFIYGLKSKMLRKTFQNYWRKKLQKSEVHNEIQARTPSTCGSRRQSLTPLGFFTRPNMQRRLSEALLDAHRASPARTKMKRIASELTWQQQTGNYSTNYSPNDEQRSFRMPQTSSCNVLQVPRADIDELSTTSLPMDDDDKPTKTTFLQKFFGLDPIRDGTPTMSPKILITRALSDDDDDSSDACQPPPNVLLEKKKWYDNDEDNEEYDSDEATNTKLLNHRFSDDSETSDASSALFINIDEPPIKTNEKRALIAWPLKDDDEEEEEEEEEAIWGNGNNSTAAPPTVIQEIVL